MQMYPFTIAINARSQFEAKLKLNLLLEWAALPVKQDFASFGFHGILYLINNKIEAMGNRSSMEKVQSFDMPLSLPGNSRQEAEAHLDLMLQWASFPISRDWKALLGNGIKLLACRNTALNEQQGNSPERAEK